ncbi:MAG TPA: DUF4160 domain-containing protein [Longimicrobium sp.]|nr:DUF4160 domain-containing protein [Longimicrobium sp.]
MPTVLRAGGFAFFFYAKDHEPAHVHAQNGDGTAIIEIETGHVIRKSGEIRKHEVNRAVSIVAEHRDYLHQEWRKFALQRGAQG